MIEDYRAGLAVDHQHDKADRDAGKCVQCPTLVLWSLRDDLERLYGDVLSVWRPWTTVLEGHGIDSGHHMAEEAPRLLADAIATFLART
jgi:haloacetate dehalogenase